MKIQEIITFLENEKKINPAGLYSINENIRFFSSIVNLSKFLKWYWYYHKKIDGSKITELTDFDNENFIRELHQELLKVERRKIPGMVAPLVIAVYKHILSMEKPALIADLGSGSMEIARQIITRLMKSGYNKQLTIVAFDKSKAAHESGVSNLAVFKDYIEIHETDSFNADLLAKIEKYSQKSIKVILSNEDVFNLSKEKINVKFDLSFHSFFKHHLEEYRKKKIDYLLSDISDKIFEYDEFYSSFGLLVHSMHTWKNPILLNGAAFSVIRSIKLQALKQDPQSIEIFKRGSILSWRGTYLRTLSNKD